MKFQMFSLVLVLWLIQICLAFESCYYPNGTASLTDIPCSPNDTTSFCCGEGYGCSQNKLCLNLNSQPGLWTFARGSCTDKTWQDPACPDFCTTDEPGFASGVYNCGSGTFCCWKNSTQCSCQNDPLLTLGAVQIFATITSSTVVPAPTALTTQNVISVFTTVVSTNVLATVTAVPVSSSKSSSSGSGLSTGAMVGIAITSAVALGSLLVLALVLARNRNRSKGSIQGQSHYPTAQIPLPNPQPYPDHRISNQSWQQYPVISAELSAAEQARELEAHR